MSKHIKQANLYQCPRCGCRNSGAQGGVKPIYAAIKCKKCGYIFKKTIDKAI